MSIRGTHAKKGAAGRGSGGVPQFSLAGGRVGSGIVFEERTNGRREEKRGPGGGGGGGPPVFPWGGGGGERRAPRQSRRRNNTLRGTPGEGPPSNSWLEEA